MKDNGSYDQGSKRWWIMVRFSIYFENGAHRTSDTLNMRCERKSQEWIQEFCHGSAITNLTSTHEDASSILGLTEWIKDPMLP